MVFLLFAALAPSKHLPETDAPSSATEDRPVDDRCTDQFRPHGSYWLGRRRTLNVAFAGDPETDGVEGWL